MVRDKFANDDPLLPWLLSIKKEVDNCYSFDANRKAKSCVELEKLVSECFQTFKHNAHYKNDIRFLKICLLRLEGSEGFENVYREIEENGICVENSSLYEWYALFLETKGKFLEANMVYQIGISRNAKPPDRLMSVYSLFLERMQKILEPFSFDKVGESAKYGECSINPWSATTMNDLLAKIAPELSKYDGYRLTNKAYPGKVALSSLANSSRNKIIEIGGMKYQIKGCAGQGNFAKVYKACAMSNPDEVVALKIQKPAFPWEFYMYRQLDLRVSDTDRPSFGFAQRMHVYSDYSILVCDYLSNGTLQDAINSYIFTGKSMEEVLCIYYTIEMLQILESLHGVNIIHGDFKPDNLLIRYARNVLTEDGFFDRIGPWRDQGLCLVDWGRAIDLNLFPDKTKFVGDCRTSGFRCVEMQEKRPWRFQVDKYGLCVVVHMMLHNSYMEIVKRPSADGGYVYQPKSSFKRYWNVNLWKNLFSKLLNSSPDEDDKTLLKNLRESFQAYMHSDPKLLKKLTELFAKQKASLCSA